MQIGFIGTGTISGAMVEGLQTIGAAPSTLVSPRSEAVSLALEARYPNVRRAKSNAEVAEAEIVVLGMRPAQLQEALAGISFRPNQIVVSLVAGLSLDEVQKLAPHSRVDRAVPMPGIARGQGPITAYPGQPEVVALLEPLGDLIVTKNEAELNMGGLSGFLSSYFELQNRLIAQARSSGASDPVARAYVTSMLAMLAGTARLTLDEHFAELVLAHQTKGGLNERVRNQLLEAGWFDMPAKAFMEITSISWKKLG